MLLTLASLSVALVAQAPWLLVLLVVAVLPSFIGETHFAGLSYSLLFRWTPQRRQLDYVRYVGASDRTAKEVQLFGLAPWLISRYRTLSDRFYAREPLARDQEGVRQLRRCRSSARSATTARTSSCCCGRSAGAISLGTLTFLAASFRQSRDLIQGLLMSASGIYEQSLYLKDLFAFFDMQPTIHSVPGRARRAVADSDGLRVRGRRLPLSRAASGGRFVT